MNKLYFRFLILTLLLCIGSTDIIAQPWTYDFLQVEKSFTTNNSNSTAWFDSIPSGGGTYRIRTSNGQGGGFVLANPGTTLGSGSELQIQASKTASSTKFSIYDWSSASNVAYFKFKFRSNSTETADFLIGIGANNTNSGYSDNNSYSNTYNNSVAVINLQYSGGNFSNIRRRISGNWSPILDVSSVNFFKNTDQEIEIYVNNSTTSTNYTRSGTNSLNTQSWDLWIDGVKMSPSGGWPKSGNLTTGTINAIGFFGESSSNNAGFIYLDDLEYSNSLPNACSAPTTATSNFVADSKTENSINLNWTDGNGVGRIIKMNTINSFTNLSLGDNPSASTTYVGGEQVIYNGTGSGPISISGLLPNTTYYFKGYEYCSPDRAYNNSGVVGDIITEAGDNIIYTDEVYFGPFCSGIDNPINVEFLFEGDFEEEFKVQISDADGNFPGNTEDNIIGSGITSPISAIIPASTPSGNGYLIRVVNASPQTIGNNNGNNIEIKATPTTPSSSIPTAVCQGNSISITASGSTNATAYTFWDSNIGGNQILSGVSGNTLTLDNTTLAGTYTYFIQAENGTCVSDRQSVALEINEVPSAPTGSFSYSNNPSCGPATIDFPSGYYFQTTANGTSTANPTSSSYILNTSGTVYVRALLGSCWSETIVSDEVVVSNPISISSQPINKSIAENRTDSFSITATNVASYQWQIKDGVNWENILGANNSSYVISNPSPTLNGLYRVVLTPTNAACDEIISNEVTLTVTAPAPGSIWDDPINGTNPGQTSGWFNSTEADGFSKDPNITVSGINKVGVSGNNANHRYNTSGWNVTSLNTGRYITWNITPNPGYELNLDTLKFTAQASGSGPTNLAIRTSADNYESDIYSSNSVQNSTTSHTVVFTGLSNITDNIEIRLYAWGTTSAAGSFSVNDFNFIGLVLPEKDCDLSDPEGTFEYSANPSCGPTTILFPAGYYYQTIPNGTTTTHPTGIPFELTTSGIVYVREFDGECWSDALESDLVVVNQPISISTQPANISVPSNGVGLMSVTATNASSYQWQENDGNGWANIDDATTSTLSFNSPDPSKNGYTYRVVMSASPCAVVISNAATLTVTGPVATSIWSNLISDDAPSSYNPYTKDDVHNSNITVSGIGKSSSLVANTGADRYNFNTWSTASSIDTSKYFTWTLTANTGYTLSLSTLNANLRRSSSGPNKIQLRTSLDDFASGSEISFTSTSSDVPFSFEINSEEIASIEIRLYGYGASQTSGTFSVNDFDFIGIVKEACVVDVPVGSFSYSANPSCGPVTIGFPSGYYFQTTETGTSISKPTSSPYVQNTSGKVYVRAYNGSCWSEAVASDDIVIITPINILSHPNNKTISTIGSGTFSVNATNVTSYQWQENDGSGWVDIPGAISSSLTFNQPSVSQNGYSYRVVLTGITPCATQISNAAVLTVVEPSGPCGVPADLNTNVSGNEVTFNWSGTGADIYVIIVKNASTGEYVKAYSSLSSGVVSNLPSGSYTWTMASLCDTETLITGNSSGWIQGNTFSIP